MTVTGFGREQQYKKAVMITKIVVNLEAAKQNVNENDRERECQQQCRKKIDVRRSSILHTASHRIAISLP